MKIFTFEQYSPEWWDVRLGIPTASNFSKILTATGKPSRSALTYAYDLVGELITGSPEESFSSEWMERGLVLEEEARTFYELQKDVDVKQVGFCLHDSGKWGCSPDGLVAEDGGLEIKCPKRSTHVKYLYNPKFLVGDYLQQIAGAFLTTDREWWDIMSYYPGMQPVIVRLTAKKSEDYMDSMRVELHKLDKLVKQIKGAIDAKSKSKGAANSEEGRKTVGKGSVQS